MLVLSLSAIGLYAQRPAAPSVEAFDKAVAAENYAEAKRLADALLPRAAPEDKLALAMGYGRVLLGLKLTDDAKKYLALMGQQNLAADDRRRLEVYAAWLSALEGERDAAVKLLEAMLEENRAGLATAEAADVLAMLYMAAGDRTNAKRAVDFGLKFVKYHSLKTDYTEALLRGRLASNIASPEAERLYLAAEKLRREEKFVEAGKQFTQLCRQHPRSEWVDPSMFRIGQCLAGLGRGGQAVEHWQKFVEESPAGPWRGQARAALIDAALYDLDLAAATEQALAAVATLAKPVDGDAAASWKAAAEEVYLRHGIVSRIEVRLDAAVEALEPACDARKEAMSAKPAGRQQADPRTAALERFLKAARERVLLIPRELKHGDTKTVTALSLGSVYNILGEYETAALFYSLPLPGRSRMTSPPHRSFASLGWARAIAGLAEDRLTASRRRQRAPGPSDAFGSPSNERRAGPATFARARALYEQSLKEHPAGTWRHETLRELALLIERMAADQYGPPDRDADGNSAVADVGQGAFRATGDRPTDKERQQQEKNLRAARAEALPHWTELTENFPTSPHVSQALYHAGVLHSEANQPAAATLAFETLVREHPHSPWTGDAQVWLIDVALEQQFDLAAAASLAQSAVAWYEKLDPAATAKARRDEADENSDGLRTLDQVGYDIYVRAGLVAYLEDRREEALGNFAKAEPLHPPRDLVVVQGTIPTGIERLVETAKSGESLTPDAVRQGDEKAKLILMLADVYHEGEQWQKSLDLCEKLIDGAAPKATREQRSWAYFKRGRNHFCLEDDEHDPDAATRDYLAAATTAPKADWADNALFLAGNIQWNTHQDHDTAVRLWQQLLRAYPDSEEAERSAFYIGVAYHWGNQPLQAMRAFDQFLEKYPGSRFAPAVREMKLEGAKAEGKTKR